MLKKSVAAAGLVLGLLATGAWAVGGNAGFCLQVVGAKNISGRALKNNCTETVEATWCYGSGCRFDNTWTIKPGQEATLESPGRVGISVDHDACGGAGSIKSRNGNRIMCN